MIGVSVQLLFTNREVCLHFPKFKEIERVLNRNVVRSSAERLSSPRPPNRAAVPEPKTPSVCSETVLERLDAILNFKHWDLLQELNTPPIDYINSSRSGVANWKKFHENAKPILIAMKEEHSSVQSSSAQNDEFELFPDNKVPSSNRLVANTQSQRNGISSSSRKNSFPKE
jgi:hypothetical protein